MNIKPLNLEYHNSNNFKEQIAVLYYAGIEDDYLKVIRSWEVVCQPAQASFDLNNPGEDTLEGWQRLDNMIKYEHVVGIFHTHPPGITSFSGTDDRTHEGLAEAYGKKYLWHGVQAYGCDYAHILCMHMIKPKIITYDFGKIKSDIEDSVLLLPLPQKMRVNKNRITFCYAND